MSAKHLILNSLSSVANVNPLSSVCAGLAMSRLTCWIQYYGTFADKLNMTESKDLTSADDTADCFVEYDKSKVSVAQIIGYVAVFCRWMQARLSARALNPLLAYDQGSSGLCPIPGRQLL